MQRPRDPAAGLDPFAQGLDALRADDKAAAIVHLRQAVINSPRLAKAHFYLAMALREQGDLAGAIGHYKASLEIETRDVDAFVNLGEALRRSGRSSDAIKMCDRAITIDAAHAESYVVRGVCKNDVGDLAGAVADLEFALTRNPKAGTAHKMLGTVLMGAKRKEEALVAFRNASALLPDDSEIFRAIGDLCEGTGQLADGMAAYEKAMDLDPWDIRTYIGLSSLLCRTSLLDLALSVTEVAIKLQPASVALHYNRAVALESLGRLDEALQSYDAAVRCKTDCGLSLISACRIKGQICDWQDLAAMEVRARASTYKIGIPTAPFGVLMMMSSLSDILECNRVWTDHIDPKLSPMASYGPSARPRDRLRIGYISADFHVHATSALIVEVFELHDRSRFEIFGYSIGRRADCAMRERLVASLDHFRDLSPLSHHEAAERIHQDGIDILIDLKGYTFQGRPEILARRPAPIQVNYLGYPSTMAAPFIDYIVGDPIVTPMEHAPFYTEKIVQLPNAYQPNDRKRPVATEVPSRRDVGLPDDAFVFCCFNANQKVRPDIFEIWMRLLRGVPGSVLWLYQKNPAVIGNIRRAATEHGVDPSRIVFAAPVSPEQHLARIQLGDLFLDTSPYGAHTTASEALWVGLLVLTYLGDTFSARVGASLVTAVGLPELIVTSYEAYDALAIRLATNPNELMALRMKLKANLGSAALFDTPRYTRDLESAFLTMAALRDSGDSPRAIVV